jgi:branched-chain amino acid aminotransferase
MAQAQGCQQVLWLDGKERYITEVGTMNVFMVLKNKKGGIELVTPPLNGLILPGVTRQSILDLGRTWVKIYILIYLSIVFSIFLLERYNSF